MRDGGRLSSGPVLAALRVVELKVPALRDRRDDVLPLARVLLATMAPRMKRPIARMSPQVTDQLLRYEWPGNVRELENAKERAVALGRGRRLELEDLPEEIRRAFPRPVAASERVRPLEEVEKDYILAVLGLNDGNQTRTAKQLGVGSATLYRKLKGYPASSASVAGSKGPGAGHEPARDELSRGKTTGNGSELVARAP